MFPDATQRGSETDGWSVHPSHGGGRHGNGEERPTGCCSTTLAPKVTRVTPRGPGDKAVARAWQIHTQSVSKRQHREFLSAALTRASQGNKQQPLGTPVSSPFTPAPVGGGSIQLIDNKSMTRSRVGTDPPPPRLLLREETIRSPFILRTVKGMQTQNTAPYTCAHFLSSLCVRSVLCLCLKS